MKRLLIILTLITIILILSGCNYTYISDYTTYKGVKVKIIGNTVTIVSEHITKNIGEMSITELKRVNQQDTYNVYTCDNVTYIFDKIE